MKDTVIVIGCDGYIGHALTLRLLEDGYKVVGIDDFQRRENVEEMGSFSAVEIEDPEVRHEKFKKIGEFHFYKFSIDLDKESLINSLSEHENISTIVNLAQQPSAPFSFKSQDHATETTTNNLIGTLNVLYYMKEFAPKAHLIQIGSMGEYDHSAGTAIPEGTFDLTLGNYQAKNVIFPRRPGSFYHASKVASTYYIDCASRWWGIRATDIMQGVVFGNWTPEVEKYNCPTRLDSDECFGTVVNRFIIQAILGEPMTVYGQGLQKRGYLSLNDSVQCLMLAIEKSPAEGYRTWNQLDKSWAVVEIAQEINLVCQRLGIETDIQRMETPRVERTDDFYYHVVTDKLKNLGFEPTRDIKHETEYIINKLAPVISELYPLRNVVIPKITWK
jgi:nucleoside-diphosphate-sugar epimerase